MRAEGFVPTRRKGRGGSVSRRAHNPTSRRPHPPLRRNQLRRKAQLKRQLLFGRGGLGERRFSQRSGLSPRISQRFVFSRGSAREGAFLPEKPPPSQSLPYFMEVL